MSRTKEKLFENSVFDEERALYNLKGAKIFNCTFAGPADGESALKECRNITVENCGFSLRYPLWHAHDFTVNGCNMDSNARAALWYCKNGAISASNLYGIKALRECSGIKISDCRVNSPEFGWRCNNIAITESQAESEYFMFGSRRLSLDNVKFEGKYSFQYVKEARITNCDFKTKDAFWHSENVTVENSVLKGEYLGWYSKGLTLVNCLISGTQPLCYCKNLRLINCRTENCDLAFEYSDVNATIDGRILSIKNPKSGEITVDSADDIIFENSKMHCKGKVTIRN